MLQAAAKSWSAAAAAQRRGPAHRGPAALSTAKRPETIEIGLAIGLGREHGASIRECVDRKRSAPNSPRSGGGPHAEGRRSRSHSRGPAKNGAPSRGERPSLHTSTGWVITFFFSFLGAKAVAGKRLGAGSSTAPRPSHRQGRAPPAPSAQGTPLWPNTAPQSRRSGFQQRRGLHSKRNARPRRD